MTPKTTITRLSPLLLLALGACSQSTPPQDISGTLALTTFSSTPTAVRAVHGGKVVVETPVAPDGKFHLRLPARSAYHLEVAADQGKPTVVFPDAAGGMRTGFYVGAKGKPFDMGTLRHMGSPAGQTYAFPPAEMVCEDGHDPATGAVCVDDDAGKDNHCGDRGGDDDGDGQGEHGSTGGGKTGAGGADSENVATDEAVVADHNLPGTMGCDDGETDDQGEHKGAGGGDGQDAYHGAGGAGGACEGEHHGAGGAGVTAPPQ